jgi:hypothetical protein
MQAERVLGHDLVSACDVVVRALPEGGEPFRRWLERDLLEGLSARFKRRGLTIKWHPSVLQWLESLKGRYQHPLELQRNLDRELAHELIRYLPEDSGVDVVTVSWDGSSLVVGPAEKPEA